jgi:malic enzyme
MKALRYHARRPTGKTQITATKPYDTATDLALAYTPGVATPCRAIQRHPVSVYRYTNKGRRSESEGVHEIGLQVPLPLGVTVEAISPERITFRLRPVKDTEVNSKPGL